MAERRSFNTGWGVSSPSTEGAETELGTRREFQSAADGSWFEAVYVLNGAAVAILEGDLCMHKAGAGSPMTVLQATGAKIPAFQLAGVGGYPIPAAGYGWIICRGICKVAGDGSVTANSTLISDATAGRAKNATLTNADEVAAAFGYAQEADGAAGSLFTAYIDI